jgi:hypothetical protein
VLVCGGGEAGLFARRSGEEGAEMWWDDVF